MICERCNLEFKTKQNLVKHLSKKKTCIPISIDKAIPPEDLIKTLVERKIEGKTYECKECKKVFADNGNRHHHQKTCKQKKITNPTTQTIVNNIVNNFHITINTFGNESTNYLTEDSVKQLFINKIDGVLNLIDKKHLNLEDPMNNNIRKNVHKDKFIQYVDSDIWKTKDKYSVIKNLLTNLGKDLVSFLNKNNDINLHEFSEEQQIKLLNCFMEQVGLPLDWFKLYETKFFQQYKSELEIHHPIDFTFGKKVKKNVSDTISERIYHFTKLKECPF